MRLPNPYLSPFSLTLQVAEEEERSISSRIIISSTSFSPLVAEESAGGS